MTERKATASALRAAFTARSREAFESWARRTAMVPLENVLIVGTGYPHSATAIAWTAWQAGRADLLPPPRSPSTEALVSYVEAVFASLLAMQSATAPELQDAIRRAAQRFTEQYGEPRREPAK